MDNSNIKTQEKFVLTITADDVTSTDERFTMDGDVYSGDNYEVVDTFFRKANGDIIQRKRDKYEHKISNQTMPRLAFQIYEQQIAGLSDEERKNFPVCKYKPNDETICGICSSIDELKKHLKSESIACIEYSCDDGSQFVIHGWNVLSTVVFVRECLKRFGEEGDKFILTYREKDKTEMKTSPDEEQKNQSKELKNPYSAALLESKNIIFRGAPGTGKSYLAKEIAADIVSNGSVSSYEELSSFPELKKQVEFVQFHPSYDYSDFVEGLRPQLNDDGSMSFKLQDGIFRRFIDRARKNYENSQKSKPYVFIIDEINRGEISKIFGELFFAIDPGYRGRAGEVSTQYANLRDNSDDKFFIPENVYIIGTMNDIDRSVDSFDFAMRRRFRFIEIKADERLEMLDVLGEERKLEAIRRMTALNKEIASVDELNENYQIGAAYFLKLKHLTFEQLWSDYLKPLLKDYIQGMYKEKEIMEKFEKAYNCQKTVSENDDDES